MIDVPMIQDLSSNPINAAVNCPHCGESISIDQLVFQQLRGDIHAEYRSRFEEATALIQVQAQKRAQEQLQEQREVLVESEAQLKELRKGRTQLLKTLRQMEDREKALDLQIEERLIDERHRMEKRFEQELRLKLRQPEKTIAQLNQRIQDLSRVGSGTQKGVVMEEDLAERLMAAFPHDNISRVKSGKRGAVSFTGLR